MAKNEKIEKGNAFEKLKVSKEKPKRRVETMVIKDKNVYRVEGLSCANCAGKFEKNVKQISGVEDAKVNFGASKIDVYGNTTIEELEKAGAFENLRVAPEQPVYHVSQEENEDTKQEKIPFYKKYSTLLYSTSFLVFGYLSLFINGAENIVTTLLFLTSMLVGGLRLFTVGFQNLLRFEFDMKTLMTVAVIGGAIIGECGEVAIVVILFAFSEELSRFFIDIVIIYNCSLLFIASMLECLF